MSEPDKAGEPEEVLHRPRTSSKPGPLTPLQWAARGVALAFVAAALQYFAFTLQVALSSHAAQASQVQPAPPPESAPPPDAEKEDIRDLPKLDRGSAAASLDSPTLLTLTLRLWLLPSLLWVLAALAAFASRLCCRKVGASVRSKRTLTAATALAALSLAFNVLVETALVLDAVNVTPLERFPAPLHALVLLSWLAWLLDLSGTVLFLYYLRGVARAHDLYEFMRDPIEVIALALIVYLVLIPFTWTAFIVLVMALGGAVSILGVFGAVMLVGLAVPLWYLVMFVTFVLMLWPFVAYCRLLLRLREALQRVAQEATDPMRKHAWPV
jgi:hypothetical protein